jgi:DNA-binding transcriptional regulator YhcF (GntR family)
MLIEIDYNSNEALYLQVCNQIILGIATSRLSEGDELPSVRAMADSIGINMHTVNKAYALLRQEGYVKVDRRRGAVIAVSNDRIGAMEDLKEHLRIALARSRCKNISREEVHRLIDEIYGEYDREQEGSV